MYRIRNVLAAILVSLRFIKLVECSYIYIKVCVFKSFFQILDC